MLAEHQRSKPPLERLLVVQVISLPSPWEDDRRSRLKMRKETIARMKKLIIYGTPSFVFHEI